MIEEITVVLIGISAGVFLQKLSSGQGLIRACLSSLAWPIALGFYIGKMDI